MRSGTKLSSVMRTAVQIWPLIPAALFLLGFLLIVLLSLIWMSFAVQRGGHTVFPALDAAMVVVQSAGFTTAMINTVVFVILGTPLELFSGIFLSLVIARSFAGRELVRSFLIIPLAIPALVTATLLFILFDYPGGHVNALLLGQYPFSPALIDSPVNWRAEKIFALGVSLLGKVWRDMPISMLIILSGINAIDPELLDAAKTMGAGFFRRLWSIILPLIVPAISAVVLLRSLEMWKEFIFPFVLAGRHNLLGTLIESLYNNWGKSDQAAVVALVLVVCIVISTTILIWCMDWLRKRVHSIG